MEISTVTSIVLGHPLAFATHMPFSTCRNTVLLACLAGTCVAYGQRFSFGVKGGVSLNDPSRINPDESKRYVLGGTVEMQLWRGFTAEVDFLYRCNGSSSSYTYNPFLRAGPPVTPAVFVANRTRLN